MFFCTINSRRKNEKLFVACIVCMFILFIVDCENSHTIHDDVKWDNTHAVYAFVNPTFKHQVLDSIDYAFENLDYKTLYVVEKNHNSSETLKLLFILNDTDTVESFRQELLKDEKVTHTSDCYDLPFDTVDTRDIECEKTNIEIGEEVVLQLKGKKQCYTQSFSYKSFVVKPQSLENFDYKIFD